MKEIDLSKLKEPFHPNDIGWRVSRAGESGGNTYAFVLAYVTNRAIMDRLDEVCGSENWKNEYSQAPDGGILCGLSIKINNDWVTKWDGAENTQFEAIKGGLSGAMKRAGVQWGIGRYLYKLTETFAIISSTGKYYQKAAKGKNGNPGEYKAFKWDAPQLPSWALPKDYKQEIKPPVKTEPIENKVTKVFSGEVVNESSLTHLEQIQQSTKIDAHRKSELTAMYNSKPDANKQNFFDSFISKQI